MEMKNMVVGLLLIAAFALPALATSFEKDFITHETVQAILKKAGPNSNGMLDEQTSFEKDFITREAVQEILKNVGPNSNGMLDEQTISALTGKIIVSNAVLEEALLKHSNSINALGGSIPCGISCLYGTCAFQLCFCSEGHCFMNSLA